ncbi:MAG TPA: zinc metalloprotease HtpX [Candidatus Magasanikbacteria bacterium]|uniref:Protease HtpX homolog n=1 Tax=Candidatus Magasanikbacteria bacterium GW2011_GWE2_42_7 TaxID=1619052 RepID=A0A0G1BEM8_9BACT|nr:MAG: Protease HtpX-like protein [Candidatus Magasanikbacteria bacterium GW2011_GWC2_42_27]KKS71747.1 MAG: Protease HtpX-like protein [Candidatus Magasanikbacteria bacterium GW2011_GWE2_42_7]HBB38427.1 zinc metalloprotease HtpX [Candidatus Magasanikbacteria bacterium]HCC14194.1 zinc metalloprotease HtpX [Candidatus Magasanikbacteria bacterium]HCM54247.1 zinc metalloprotease HtpX [Candidatus Magasanikbacteria bacterium]
MYNQITSNKRKTRLLMLIFFCVVIGIGYIFNYLGYGYGAVILAFVISMFMTWLSYFHGDKIALKSAGAKEITKEDNPYVYRMVENLTITAGMPMPRVHIIDSPAMNAFATGRDPEHASIAFTTGIINALENEELEGVAAHELSHVQNLDIRVMTIVIVLVGTIALLSDMFFRMSFFGGRSSENKGAGGVLAIVGIALMILSPIIAEIIKLAISRKREYLADASGSLLTRYPEGLARALEKISASNVPLATANSATAHLFISNPFKGKRVSNIFSTHPPIEDRVKKLRGMA